MTDRNEGRWLRRVAVAAATGTFLVLVLGGAGTSRACPDWPLCGASPLTISPIEALVASAHQVAGALAFVLALAATLLLRSHRKTMPWAWSASLVVLGLFVVQGVAGAIVALGGARPLPVGFHLALALLTLAVQVGLVALLFGPAQDDGAFDWPTFSDSLARQSLGTSALAFVLLVSGATMAVGPAGDCAGSLGCTLWTLSWQLFEPQGLVHRIVAAGVALAVFWLTSRVWRMRRQRPASAVAASVTAGLMLAQVSIGALGAVRSLTAIAADLHVGTAGAVWATLILTTMFLATERPRPVQAQSPESLPRAARVGDYLALTKPLIVALLLVTTLAGMVVGAGGWPSLSTIVWTMIGGALSAGGAGALNQYLDRELDGRMQRTERRPLPARRLSEAEVLAFGLLACLAGFFVMAVMVNLLSALLSLAGMVYYVVLYTIILKQATTQNIVVGGGAGAIPPLVGWAAATNSLNIGAFFLFALVFFWTPPHFWALALVRRKDYARAGVPMLPVVYGDAHARWQIMLYTVQLVALTLLMPAVHVGGRVYLVAAIMLGGGLLLTAWRLWREGGNRLAWRMYRVSSMYLAFIFVALVLDTLLDL